MPRSVLKDIIRRDPALLQDGRRLKACMADLCAGAPRLQVEAILVAQKKGVALQIAGSDGSVPAETLIGRLSARLHDEAGLREDVARWAVESWALAIGLVSAPDTVIFQETFKSDTSDPANAERQQNHASEIPQKINHFTGKWHGYYMQQGRRYAFDLFIESLQDDGRFTGRITEPMPDWGYQKGLSGTVLQSQASGILFVENSRCIFRKFYQSMGYIVGYSGEVNGYNIEGHWSINGVGDRFAMEKH